MNKVPEFQQKYYEALLLATTTHGSQMYDKDKPYLFHLTSVAMTLTRFGFSIETYIDYHIAALLHDSVEDTDMKIKEIRSRFGDRVARIVDLVTDEKGETREERHLKTYPKLALDRDAVVLKLADRITNVEYSEYTSNLKQYRKYRREYKYFRDTLFNENHIEAIPMWKTLDRIFDYEV